MFHMCPSYASCVPQYCEEPLHSHAFPFTTRPVAHGLSGVGFSAEPGTSAMAGWRKEDQGAWMA